MTLVEDWLSIEYPTKPRLLTVRSAKVVSPTGPTNTQSVFRQFSWLLRVSAFERGYDETSRGHSVRVGCTPIS